MYRTVPRTTKESRTLRFLYHTKMGHVCLRAAVSRPVSAAAGHFLDSRLSRPMIRRFVRKNHIRVSDFEARRYRSYNDFFTRRILPQRRPVDMTGEHLISPCDAKLSAYRIRPDSTFRIKGGTYSTAELLQDPALAAEFADGYCLIFRLSVDDYHRYCYFDDGKKGRNIFIRGKLHTVRDIAAEQYDVYQQNCREYTVMDTVHFGRAVQIEVGAMLVGRICNHEEEASFTRGSEKGMFEFGGSTIVLLLKENAAEIAPEILRATAEGCETVVRMGECIGRVPSA